MQPFFSATFECSFNASGLKKIKPIVHFPRLITLYVVFKFLFWKMEIFTTIKNRKVAKFKSCSFYSPVTFFSHHIFIDEFKRLFEVHSFYFYRSFFLPCAKIARQQDKWQWQILRIISALRFLVKPILGHFYLFSIIMKWV